jgi:predicted enzyme related to lactoylglutathione lyase
MTTPQSTTESRPFSPASTAARYCWHDLMTTDLARARAFYVALLGWEIREMDMGPEAGAYPMMFAGDQGVGGMVQLRPDQPVASHWLGYVAVPDVDGLCARIPSLGGAVMFGPADIPEVGRFAVIADPAGAHVAPITLLSPEPEPASPPMGTVAWNELLTTDADDAARFYGAAFGWSHTTVDMGPLGMYWLLRTGEKDRAGILRMPDDAHAPPMWVPYFAVADVDVAARQAEELGAQLFVRPRDIPGVGRFSVCGDPTGATFALYRGGEW